MTGIGGNGRDAQGEEAEAYEKLGDVPPLDALFAVLPAWCLQDRIGLVRGGWWDDADVMELVAAKLKERFLQLGHGEAPCQYFHDSCLEAIDAYQREVSAGASELASRSVSELVGMVHDAREANPRYETDGYGDALPAWLICKEQLIWNTVVCALYGPSSARPLLASLPALLAPDTGLWQARLDVITSLARSSFKRYTADRMKADEPRMYRSFHDLPADLHNSSIEHIRSIPDKLKVLGFEIVPEGSCYPDQRVSELSPSEVECLAILEHRRWLDERKAAGWRHGAFRDADAKTSPYLVPWENLPDRAKEWNRSAVRNIPTLLASEGLAVVRR